MRGDPFVYAGTNVLINLFDIRDADALNTFERQYVGARALDGCPEGNFDLKHLQAIHKHLFQDVYAWAGELRTVNISKGESHFQPFSYIETGMADVHQRLVKAKFLEGLDREGFAEAAGKIIGDVNYVHPFREGNGRTQFQYLEQLAEGAGHSLAVRDIDPKIWIEASQRANNADYGLMSEEIARALGQRSPTADRTAPRDDDFAAQMREISERAKDEDRDPDRD